jgi:hypothetical protein
LCSLFVCKHMIVFLLYMQAHDCVPCLYASVTATQKQSRAD